MNHLLMVLGFLLTVLAQKPGEDPVNVITVVKTTVEMETGFAVYCDGLSKLYPRDTFFIYEKKSQQRLLQLIGQATPSSAITACNIDTRARIFISHESGQTDSLCLGYGYLFSFNGRCMQLSRFDLINLLIQMDKDSYGEMAPEPK